MKRSVSDASPGTPKVELHPRLVSRSTSHGEDFGAISYAHGRQNPLRALAAGRERRNYRQPQSKNVADRAFHSAADRRCRSASKDGPPGLFYAQFGEQMDEMLSREQLDLRSMLEEWLRRVGRRREEHLGRQKAALRSLFQEHHLPQCEAELKENGSVIAAEACQPEVNDSGNVNPPPSAEVVTRIRPPGETEPPLLPAPSPQPVEAQQDQGTGCEPSRANKLSILTADSKPSTEGRVSQLSPCGSPMRTEKSWTRPDVQTVTPKPARLLYPNSWRTFVQRGDKLKTPFPIWRMTEAQDNRTSLQRITRSHAYEWCSTILIFLNAFFIGYQTEWMASCAEDLARQNRQPTECQPTEFYVVEVLFFLLFSAEVGLRWMGDGTWGFFHTVEVGWNVFDICVIFASFLDLAFGLAQLTSSDPLDINLNVSILRVMRIVRVIRVAKVIRVMRFFRELRMMIYSILGSARSLLWSLTVLLLMFFIFGISLTAATINHLSTPEMWQSAETEDLRHCFSSLARSILSLYQAMSGGRSWGEFLGLLWDLPVLYPYLFLMFVTVSIFAVVNVVTGIFVENAMQKNLDDTELLVQEELEAKREYFRQMQVVFEELDEDNTGFITIEEFENKLEDERVLACFNIVSLEISDARMLFQLLDYDQSGEVAIEEFVAGCDKLKGGSRSLDLAIMELEIRWLKEAFLGFADFMESTLTQPGQDLLASSMQQPEVVPESRSVSTPLSRTLADIPHTPSTTAPDGA